MATFMLESAKLMPEAENKIDEATGKLAMSVIAGLLAALLLFVAALPYYVGHWKRVQADADAYRAKVMGTCQTK